jgi:hypothetical protein
MYELSQRLSLLFLTSTAKIYAQAKVRATISIMENIPDPSPQDITITSNASGGKDIEIKLRAIGTPALETQTLSKTIDVDIINAGQELDEQGVRDAVGSKVYNVTTKLYKGEVLKDSKQNELTNESNVEID